MGDMANVVVKTVFRQDIRRITVPSQDLSFDTLCEKIRQAYALPECAIVLKFEDEEGDLVSM